jgi:hypothetical protein
MVLEVHEGILILNLSAIDCDPLGKSPFLGMSMGHDTQQRIQQLLM